MVLFGSVGSSAQEFVYRIKATNKGKYIIPPVSAESMYDRAVRARTLSGTMVVEEKKAEAKQEVRNAATTLVPPSVETIRGGNSA